MTTEAIAGGREFDVAKVRRGIVITWRGTETGFSLSKSDRCAHAGRRRARSRLNARTGLHTQTRGEADG